MSRTIIATSTIFVAATFCLGSITACVDTDERPATWSYIHATIIAPNCTTSRCHSSYNQTADLALDDRSAAYAQLTGRSCDTGIGLDHNFVYPGDPDRSKLMFLLRGIEVRQMPPDIPLSDAEIDLVERWILEGALCND